MCKTPKAPKPAPSVIDTASAVEEGRTTRRRRRGYLSQFRSSMLGDMTSAPVAVKELTGQ